MKHSWIKYLDSGHAGDNNGFSVPGHVDVKLYMGLNLKTTHTVTFVLFRMLNCVIINTIKA